ncbi:MAG TPA: hypothetical protein VNU44_14460 [Bryobacteraceae bacterium]|nr:hypothetical protein [Bryobacteraceae bacterium]
MRRALHPVESSAAAIVAGERDWPAYTTPREWTAAGFLWQPKICDREGCGLPVWEFFLPNDFPFRVDPQTGRPHADVCGDKARVRAMRLAEERREIPALDWKQRQAGER